MLQTAKSAQVILETLGLKKGQKILLLTHPMSWPMRLAEILMHVARSMKAEVVLMVMDSLTGEGEELPSAVATAMKTVDYVLLVSSGFGIGHSVAVQEARVLGVKVKSITDLPEGFLEREFSIDDLYRIKERTEAMASRLAAGDVATVSSPYGTNVTMSLKGRQAMALTPFGQRGGLPDYSEATITPVEGTAEGVIVVDLAVFGWGCLLREPLRCTIKAGKVVAVSGLPEEAERLMELVNTDEGASNIAELAIGGSHTVTGPVLGTRRDAARLGYVHVAIGRNNDIGGNTYSKIHVDCLLTRATMHLDGVCILKDGVLQL